MRGLHQQACTCAWLFHWAPEIVCFPSSVTCSQMKSMYLSGRTEPQEENCLRSNYFNFLGISALLGEHFFCTTRVSHVLPFISEQWHFFDFSQSWLPHHLASSGVLWEAHVRKVSSWCKGSASLGRVPLLIDIQVLDHSRTAKYISIFHLVVH